MKTRSRAFVLNFCVKRDASRSSVVITAADQPYLCACSDVLVGLHGTFAHNEIVSLRPAGESEKSGRLVKILVRPGVDSLVSRSSKDGLDGMRCFDATTAKKGVKSMMGGMWWKAVEASPAQSDADVCTNVDWDDPKSYMCRFPRAAGEIFKMLPDLDLMVAFTPLGRQVRRVAVVPIAKLKALAEWGEADGSDSGILVRTSEIEVQLPKRTYPLPIALRAILGRDRHEKGDHPLRGNLGPSV